MVGDISVSLGIIYSLLTFAVFVGQSPALSRTEITNLNFGEEGVTTSVNRLPSIMVYKFILI